MESFGNAKTVRNNNSSRFGKWLTVNFMYKNVANRQFYQIIGAHITQFLLEKSRVVSQGENERNYHIFYQICAANKWDPSTFLYLNSSGVTTVDGVNDEAEYRATNLAFSRLKFSSDQSSAIISVLKAILHLGNLTFHSVDESTHHGKKCIITHACHHSLEQAAQFMSLNTEYLEKALTTKYMKGKNETIEMALDSKESANIRNIFSKELYNRLFVNIVEHINKILQPAGSSSSSNVNFIGLLDVFGFEIFQFNSFEQLCINYANEKLQQYFVNYVIQREQQIYEMENISFTKILPRDNADVLELLEARPHGIFCRLDEELRLPKGSDEGFLKKVADHYIVPVAKGSSASAYQVNTSRFQKGVKLANNEFDVLHFAGKVRYNCANFLDKNKDRLFDHCETVLASCSAAPIRDLLLAPEAEETAKVVNSLSNKFQKQLHVLMQILDSSDAHFIKCIKPNTDKSYEVFDHKLVLGQLQYSGVLDAIQIRKSGFSVRRTILQFISSYWITADKNSYYFSSMSQNNAVHYLINYAKMHFTDMSYDSTNIQVGSTIVFFNPQILADLEKRRSLVMMPYLQKVQCFARMAPMFYKRFPKMLKVNRRILELMAIGEEENRSNIFVLTELEALCDDAHGPLKLECFIMNDADALVSRLKLVKKFKDSVEVFLNNFNKHLTSVISQGSANQYEVTELNVSTAYSVVSENERSKGLITWSESLNISEYLIGIKFYQKIEILQRACTAAKNLKDSIDFGVELAIQSAIDNMTTLYQTIGMFHVDEIFNAKAFLELMHTESIAIDTSLEVVQNIKVFRSQQEKSKSTSTKSRNVNQINLDYDLQEFKSLLSNAIEVMHSSISGFDNKKVTCTIHRFLMSSITCVNTIFARWREDDCALLLNALQNVVNNAYLVYSRTKSVETGSLSSIFDNESVQVDVQVSKKQSIRPDLMGDSLLVPEAITHTSRMQLLSLVKNSKALIKIIEKDIYVNKAVPLIYNALMNIKKSKIHDGEDEAAASSSSSSSASTIDLHSWEADMEKIRQFQIDKDESIDFAHLLGDQNEEMVDECDIVEDAIILFDFFVKVVEKYMIQNYRDSLDLVFADPASLLRAFSSIHQNVATLKGVVYYDSSSSITSKGSTFDTTDALKLLRKYQDKFIIETIYFEEKVAMGSSNKLMFILQEITADVSRIQRELFDNYLLQLCRLTITAFHGKLFSIEEIHKDYLMIQNAISVLDTALYIIEDIKTSNKIVTTDLSNFYVKALQLMLNLRLNVSKKSWVAGNFFLFENNMLLIGKAKSDTTTNPNPNPNSLSDASVEDIFDAAEKLCSDSQYHVEIIVFMKHEVSSAYEVFQFEIMCMLSSCYCLKVLIPMIKLIMVIVL